MGKSIGVFSLKGGVGKTSSVVALGDAIASLGKKVLLVDANFSAPNLGMHLNIINPEVTIHDVLDRVANISDAIYDFGERFHVLPASMNYPKEINPYKLKDKLSYWKNKYDYVLIDTSPSMNDETYAAMLASDELLVVTTPDVPTLGTTIKAVNMARKRGTPIIGLILNKVRNKNFELSLKDIETTSDVPVMAVIPEDINILKALSKSVPLTYFKPKSEASVEYKKLAGTLIGEAHKPKRIKDIFKKMRPDKQTLNREIYYSRLFRD
ncbi:AAA family ATPase [Candidatus Pacearchaeota archaeon]|nr:AAA family ATPase [Candidatus Pacearchaeota archaeon]